MNWKASKDEAADFFKKQDFLSALRMYQEAATILENTEDGTSKNKELAKIYSNVSLMNRLLYDESGDRRYVEPAIDAALKSIQKDVQWSKGYFRLSQATLYRVGSEDVSEIIASMIEFMRLATDKEKQSPAVLEHLKELNYYRHRMVLEQSPSWHLLRFPENVRYVDQNGAGHFESLSECLESLQGDNDYERGESVVSEGVSRLLVSAAGFLKSSLAFYGFQGGSVSKGVSILVGPGTYTGVLAACNMTLDIVGDCNVDVEDKTGFLKADPVVILQNVKECFKSKLPDFSHTLTLFECDSLISRLSIFENATSSLTHTMAIMKGKALVDQCSVRSVDSSSIIVDKASASVTSCRSFNSGSFLTTGGEQTFVKVDKCYVSESNDPAIQHSRKAKILKILKSKFVGCKKAVICTASGAKKIIIKGCLFMDNCGEHTREEGSIYLRDIQAVVHNTTFDNNKGSGIMIEGGRGEFHGVVIRNSYCGFVLHTPVTISSCTIQGCMIGLNMDGILGGNIVLKDNQVIDCVHEIARYDESLEPVFLGDCRHDISTLNVDMLVAAEAKKRKRERKEKSLPKACAFCGLSEKVKGHKFLVCGGCKSVSYCSMECQKEDWKIHKVICSTGKKMMDSYKQAKSEGNAAEIAREQHREFQSSSAKAFLSSSEWAKKWMPAPTKSSETKNASLEVVTDKLENEGFGFLDEEKEFRDEEQEFRHDISSANDDVEKPQSNKKKKKKKKKKGSAW